MKALKLYDIPKSSEGEQKSISPQQFVYNINWAFEILRCLLQSGVNGDWEEELKQDPNQQSFINSFDDLILLRSSEGAKPPRMQGDNIFNKYRQHAYISLLRPSAFLQKTKETEIRINQIFNSDSEFSFVMFIGWRKPDLSGSEELWHVEDGLMNDLQNDVRKQIHFYCVLPLGDGINYINVVIGRKLQDQETPIALMSNGTWHRRAIMSASPVSYSWVRIHGGSLQFHKSEEEEKLRGVVHIKRTLCVEFGPQMPGRLPIEIAKRFNLPTTSTSTTTENKNVEEDEEFKAALLQCPYARRGVIERFVEKKNIEYKF